MRGVSFRLLMLLVVLLGFSTAHAEDHLLTFLQKGLSFSERDIDTIRGGTPVAKLLDTEDKREVAVVGVVRIRAPKEFVVNESRDIVKLKKGKEVLQVGMFSSLNVEDLKGLTLDPEEVEALRGCTAEKCGLKLPAKWIQKLSEVSKGSGDRVNGEFRQLLVDYVNDYLNRGNRAVVQYDIGKKPLRLEDEFESIRSNSSYLAEYAPEFDEYLREYPDKELPGKYEYVYWSKDKFGFKPVISLTHITIYPRTLRDGSIQYWFASKQIYASHYYDGSMGLTIIMDQGEGKDGCYVIYINRSRVDALDGFLSSLRRAIALPRIRKSLASYLSVMKTRLESDYDSRLPGLTDLHVEERPTDALSR